ncbi:RNA polymerase sigma factor [Alcaligenes faecalis]|uniref:RNA polymerase sigma factor n=1 Tax=Alcaligenes faecalis TaxID=511 RepID=UPI0029329011|nr:sigma-70 family RNA polymerase sigma factor [Alcaligenes faecalis]MDV2116711.1 sigma-70 family RNA polymerase sigma factor [Alcaligenes faecalis]
MLDVESRTGFCREHLCLVFTKDRAQLARIAFDIVKNAAVAEEIIQDAYVRVCHGNIPEEIRNSKAYCCQVVRNIALDIYRRSVRQGVHISDDYSEHALGAVESACKTPEQTIYFKQVWAAVLAKLSAQPECQRQAFLLHYAHNMTQREIAIELSCSAASVNTYLKNVREALMRCEICRAFVQYSMS